MLKFMTNGGLVLFSLFAAGIASVGHAEDRRLCRELRRFPAAEAHQGVAVDVDHFYAVTNRAVAKYDKQTGRQVAAWQAPADSPLKHLNSGTVVDGKLYCAHSNWPTKPRRNSIEIWDAKSLKHIDRREFNDRRAALTWIDRSRDHWWLVFAYYDRTGPESVEHTELVKFDSEWRQQAAWKFPASVIERFAPYSNSGGSWGPDGLLYVTGHDHGEMYALRIPAAGKTLEHVDTVPLPIAGQGIAWDRSDIGVVYGIRRAKKEVVVARLSHASEYESLKLDLSWQRHPGNPILPPGEAKSFDATRCMNPWALRNGDEYQLYYSGGDASGRQRICLATSPVDDVAKLKRHGPLFETGEAGDFDARWCVLPHVVQFAPDRWHLYFTGNAGRGTGLSAFPGIGVAVSSEGRTWTKHNKNPVLRSSGNEGDADAIGIAGGSLLRVKTPGGKNQWRFYYTGCPTTGSPLMLNQQKTICLAVSEDGIEWLKRGPVMFRDPSRDYENVGVAGPVVHELATLLGKDKADDLPKFGMWYSAIGTRWGYYSICYAESDDGIRWRRGAKPDGNLQLTPQGSGWEQQMVEYPSIIREGERLRMFYCGNGYGHSGIGTAVSSAIR